MLIVFTRAQLNGHPVTHRRKFGVAGGIVPNLTTHHAINLLGIIKQGREINLCLSYQPSWHPAILRGLIKGLFKVIIPSEIA